jgi:dihydrofolate synthase/folylpolyglutamate synthase
VVSVDYSGRPSPILKVGLKAFGEQFELNSPLAGTYQVENIVTAGSTVQALIKKGWLIQRDNYIDGISNVVANTGLQGRWQVLSEAPLTICDCGHNIDGVNELVQLLDKTEHHQLHIVWGMVSDKDSKAVLSMLPKDAIYYFCAPDIPRAMEVEVLVEHAKKFNLNGSRFPSVSQALNAAKNRSTEEDLVFVGGSTFVVAEVV